MLGTIVNVGTILAGSTAGCLFKKGIGEKYTKVMTDAIGLAAVGLGLNSSIHAMPDSEYKVMFIVCLALGGVIGTAIDIDGKFNGVVNRFSKGSSLATGLSMAILLYCVGTFSIVGPMQSALQGDNTFLYTNAMLDGITSVILSSTYGSGIAFAALAVFCWQGSIYLLAKVIEPFITAALLTEISIVGGFLILASGLSILKIKEIKTLNYLPALFLPAIAIPLINLIF